MIDAHAHLDFKDFKNDFPEILSRFFDNNGKFIITMGVNKKRNQAAVQIALKNEKIFAAIGFHPDEADKVELDDAVSSLDFLLKKSRAKIVAIGEIGLDYFHNQNNKQQQKTIFQAQLDLAKKYNLPVVIHCREAYQDMRKILEKNSDLAVVLHCYMGNEEQTERFLQLPNLKFSFTGNITFSSFEKYQQGTLSEKKAEIFRVIEKISLDKIIAETDCPFLAPTPFRGKRNEPAMVKEVIKRLAEIKGVDFKAMEKQTDKNAIEFYHLPLIHQLR